MFIWCTLFFFFSVVLSSLIPEKLMREWKQLVLRGLPLYEPVKGHQPDNEFSATLDPVELKKQEILNNQDYDEYTVSLTGMQRVFKSRLNACAPKSDQVLFIYG